MSSFFSATADTHEQVRERPLEPLSLPLVTSSAPVALATSRIVAMSDARSDSRSDGSSDDGAPPTRTPMKNTSRERMLAETAFLRARVQELERELSQTLAKKALEPSAMATPVWRDLAKRQAARRDKAEQEREQLRARLLHQLQIAKSLETIFRNRSSDFLDDLCANADANGRKLYPVDNLAALHDVLMDEIDQLYPQVDAIFPDVIVPEEVTETPLKRSTVVSEQTKAGEKLYIEVRTAGYVPFTFERVCNAVWQAITTEYARQQRLVELHWSTDDEFSCLFSSHNSLLARNHDTMAVFVMRKFTDDNRMVLVWRSLDWDPTRPVDREYGDNPGWLQVSRDMNIDPTTGERKDGAIMQLCDRYKPTMEVQSKLLEDGAVRSEHVASNDESSGFHVGEFTNRILGGVEEDMTAITESIENILLDEAIGSGNDDLESMIHELGALRDPHSVTIPTSTLPRC